jgi:hypothetical protein
MGQGGRVLCTRSPEVGETLPKITIGLVRRGGGAESGRPASGRRTRGGWSPCRGRASVGLERRVGATTSASTGTYISGKKLMSWRREHVHG